MGDVYASESWCARASVAYMHVCTGTGICTARTKAICTCMRLSYLSCLVSVVWCVVSGVMCSVL